jgi:hypothetical protein
MTAPQVLQGTWQQLSIHAAALGDKQITLVIPGEEDQETERGPRLPEVVKTQERLEELLLQGLASPGHEMTDADWDELERRAEQRAKGKQA